MTAHVLVMAKAPVPGRAKTRLCPPCTPEQAAAIAEAALTDTLAAVDACVAERRIVALDGAPGHWLPAGFEVIPQRGLSFADRLANAWEDAAGPGIQIGMDTPQVRPEELDRLLGLVRPGHAVLGHALDGGWWVIGFDGVDPHAVFDEVPMSNALTGHRQRLRLQSLGLAVSRAPDKRDIDTVADLASVCAGSARLRTTRLWHALRATEAVA